jgi:hypothetical protein
VTAVISANSSPAPAANQAPKRDRRDQQHDRHEHRREAVDQPLDRRLGRLRVLDQPDDFREHGFGADRGRFDFETAAAIDRAGGHPVARVLVDRQALAGQHRFVDRAGSRHDQAVDWNAVAAAHQHLVTQAHVVDRNIDRVPVAQQRRRLGPQRGKQADRLRGLASGARFEPAAQ